MASRSAQDHYSDKCEQSQDDHERTDQEERDFLAEFTLEKIHELERSAYEQSSEPWSAAEIAELMAALGPSDSDVVAPASIPQDAEWLVDFKALARKHRPFSTTQMVQILRALNAVDDPAADAGTNR
jgi:hypothetical protein